MDKPFHIRQTILKVSSQPIHVVPVHEADANAIVALTSLLASIDETPLGLAGAYEKSQLVCLALSSPTHVVLFRFAATAKRKNKKSKAKANNSNPQTPGRAMLVDILSNPELWKIGSNMDRLVTALFMDLDIRIAGAMDLVLLKTSKKTAGLRGATEDLLSSLGGQSALVDLEQVKLVFASEAFSSQPLEMSKLALRAWASVIAGSRNDARQTIMEAAKYDTIHFNDEVRLILFSPLLTISLWCTAPLGSR
jgi:hypothetical protein